MGPESGKKMDIASTRLCTVPKLLCKPAECVGARNWLAGSPMDPGAHLVTTTKAAVDSLSPRRRSGERVRERGFQKSAPIRWNEPLSPTLSSLVPRGAREQKTSAMVGVSRCVLDPGSHRF
jgi:hypothetical protein